MAETAKDFVFDLSLLEENLYGDSATVTAKQFQAILNDVTLNSAWMNNCFINSTATARKAENTDNSSDTDSHSGGASTVPSSKPKVVDNNRRFEFFSDNELLMLSIKELNSLVRTVPKDIVKEIKKRRRTLKNRGYAQSCRVKRLEEKSNLEFSKQGLERDNEILRHELETATKERDLYKEKYETLVFRLTQYSNYRK